MVIMPTQDNVVVRLPKAEKEQTTKSGIVIAGTQQDIPEKGIVVAVGTGRILNDGTVLAPQVPVESEIIFNKFAGTRIASGEDEFLIIKENDILAIIK